MMDQLFVKVVILVFMVNLLRLVLKFISKLFKRLGSDESIDDKLDGIEKQMDDAADKCAAYFKSKKEQRKRKREEKNKPIVEIH